MATITINNQQIHYVYNGVESDGVTVVLIHGAGGRIQSWPYQWQDFRMVRSARRKRWMTDFPLYLVDLPGHGQSQTPSHSSVNEYAHFVAQFVEALQLSNVVLAGHSMGGAIVQTVALDSPAWLSGVILLGTGAKMPVSDFILNGLQTDFAKTVHLIMKFSWHKQTTPLFKQVATQHMLSTPSEVVHGDFFACSQFDARAEIGRISVPTLIIAGANDKMMPVKASQFLADHIPNAQLALIENAGHFMMVEKTAQTTRAIVKFLQQIVD